MRVSKEVIRAVIARAAAVDCPAAALAARDRGRGSGKEGWSGGEVVVVVEAVGGVRLV